MGLQGDPLFAAQHDRALWPAANAQLEAIFASQPRDHWAVLFAASEACVAPVLSPWEAASDPHMQARAVWSETTGALQPSPAPRFDDMPRPIQPSCQRDGDRDAILAELNTKP
jgi:crotonobetainyl-CoA:carnitine CoA-transferase CaiB-like acyl-CoA transferase